MITLVESEKAKQAKEQIGKICLPLLNKFLERDLEKLRDKTSVDGVIAYVKSTASSVYNYAKLLDNYTNMKRFQKAIHLLSQSAETKRGGLFYRHIVGNKDRLSEAESEIEKFWRSSSDTDSVGEDNKQGPNIIKKLNSNRLSGVLKAFIALVAWHYINITEGITEPQGQKNVAAEKEKIQKLGENRKMIIEKIKNYFEGKSNDFTGDDINPFKGIDEDDIIDLKSRIKDSKLLKNLCYELTWVEYCNKSLDRPSSTQEFLSGVNLFYDISECEFSIDEVNDISIVPFANFLRNSKILSSFSVPFINDLRILWWMIPHCKSDDRTVRRIIPQFKEITDSTFFYDTLKEKVGDKIIESQPPTIDPQTPYRKQEAAEILTNINKHLEKIKNMCGETSKILVQATQELIVKPLEEQMQKAGTKPKSTKSIIEGTRYVPYGNKQAGEGAFGKVQVYWDNEEKIKVAVKTNKNGKPFDERQIDKVKRVNSAYVAKIIGLIDIGTGPNTGLVMEYVHGKTSFAKAIHRFSGNNKKIFEICSQLVHAFKAFADAGLSHSDLMQHSNNILIDKNDNIKIIDYDNAGDIKDEKDSIKNTVETIASVLVATDYESFEKFKNKLRLEFQLYNRRDLSSAAKLVSKDSLPGFERLLETLRELEEQG